MVEQETREGIEERQNVEEFLAGEYKQRAPHPQISVSPSEWISRNSIEILLALLFLLGLLLVANPFGWFPVADNSSATRWYQFAYWTNWEIIGGVILLMGLVLVLYRLRWRAIHHEPWSELVCPNCQALDLKRIHRQSSDHWLGRAGVPVRRYFCANCNWRGLRIGRSDF